MDVSFISIYWHNSSTYNTSAITSTSKISFWMCVILAQIITIAKNQNAFLYGEWISSALTCLNSDKQFQPIQLQNNIKFIRGCEQTYAYGSADKELYRMYILHVRQPKIKVTKRTVIILMTLESSKETVQRDIEVQIFEVMDSLKSSHIDSLIYNPVEQTLVQADPQQGKYCALFPRSQVSVGEVFGFHVQ